MVLSAWRRQVELARALVSSSNFDGCNSGLRLPKGECEARGQCVSSAPRFFLTNFVLCYLPQSSAELDTNIPETAAVD
jgi:hypothetical protein